MPYALIDQYSRRELRHALKRADPAIFEDVLNFLEDDPKTFGSGYVKEDMWRYIRRYPLDETHIARLENAALKYLKRPMSREFRDMCRAMTWIATPDFWSRVAEKIQSDNPQEQVNAWSLYGYSNGILAGEKRRLECKTNIHYGIAWRYKHQLSYTDHTSDRLLALLYEARYWYEGQVVHRDPNPDDLPVVYYMAQTKSEAKEDRKFAALDMSAANIDMLLPELERFLMEGMYWTLTVASWLYIIYLMRQMNDARVVPVLIKFLETRVDYKFESVTKSVLTGSVLKVLRYYATPEALAVVEAPREDHRAYTNHFAGKSRGWVLSYP
jgi:hypothetical protein